MTSLTLSNKSPNKKQNSRFSINDITNQYFRKFLNKFKNSPYLYYKSKHDHNELTEAYLFLIKQIIKKMKIERHVWSNSVKSSVKRKLDTPTKYLDTSTNQYNISNQKATTKWLHARIIINKLRVRMILREKKRLWSSLKRKKRHVIVMFVSMHVVNNYALQSLNARVQHR